MPNAPKYNIISIYFKSKIKLIFNKKHFTAYKFISLNNLVIEVLNSYLAKIDSLQKQLKGYIGTLVNINKYKGLLIIDMSL